MNLHGYIRQKKKKRGGGEAIETKQRDHMDNSSDLDAYLHMTLIFMTMPKNFSLTTKIEDTLRILLGNMSKGQQGPHRMICWK